MKMFIFIFCLLTCILYSFFLLTFAPKEQDDRYILKLLEIAYNKYDYSSRKPSLITSIFVGFAYFILKVRKQKENIMVTRREKK